MKNKHVLILGGSSDIGIEVVKNFLNLGWKVTAHCFKNKKKLANLRKRSKNLDIIKLDFSNYINSNIENRIDAVLFDFLDDLENFPELGEQEIDFINN